MLGWEGQNCGGRGLGSQPSHLLMCLGNNRGPQVTRGRSGTLLKQTWDTASSTIALDMPSYRPVFGNATIFKLYSAPVWWLCGITSYKPHAVVSKATQLWGAIKDISTQTCMNIHLNAQLIHVSESSQHQHLERVSAHRRGNFSNCLSSSDLLCWVSLWEI